MKKRFERFLSLSLLFTVLLVFVSSILMNLKIFDPQIVNEVWNISFIISWVLMLIYPLYILMEKDTRPFSIIVGIVSVIVFTILSYHALLIASSYTSFIPKYIAIDERISKIWQEVYYTGLILIYAVHIINLLLLNRLRSINNNKN